MKKNGTLAQKLLHDIRERNAKLVSLKRVAATPEFYGADRAGRALRVLEAAGHLEKIGRGTFLVIDQAAAPALTRNITWSNPRLSDPDTLIAAHLVKPHTDDIRVLAYHYGPKRVRAVLSKLTRRREIAPHLKQAVKHALDNITAGFADGARAS